MNDGKASDGQVNHSPSALVRLTGESEYARDELMSNLLCNQTCDREEYEYGSRKGTDNQT